MGRETTVVMRMNRNGERLSDGLEKRGTASDRGAPERSAWLRARLTLRPCPLGTPPRRIARSVIRDGRGRETALRSSQISCTSRRTSNFGRWDGSIRKNIIGHRMRPRREQFLCWGRLWRLAKPLRVIDQQAREHGASTFFDPLVNQRSNLLAEIGGVSQAREFVALKGIARSREKKLPRRLGWATGHDSYKLKTEN